MFPRIAFKCTSLLLGVIALACVPRTQSQSTPSAPASTAPMPLPTATTKSNDAALALPPLAEKLGLPLGVAVEPYVLNDLGDVVARHFNRIVAENSMKWGEVCRVATRCDWTRADAIADFARQHKMKMTGHAFIWHQMFPAWLFKEGKTPVTKPVLIERMRKHIFQLMERYADVVDNWDVVNEAISDKPGRLWRQLPEQSSWYEAFGSEEYVAEAFKIATEASAKFAPDTKLYYNDYSIENPDKRKKAIELIRGLRQRGIRVDGVGIQGHIQLGWPNVAELGRAIDEFAAESLLVKISELDVSVYTADDLEKKLYQKELVYDANLEQQLAERYVALFQLFRQKSSKLTSVTFWGLSDDRTWLNGWPIGRKNYPMLLDRMHQPKLAMKRLLELP
jgi:endo-1,4-beta-xylanase